MPNYNLKIVYPTTAIVSERNRNETSRRDFISQISLDDLVAQYNHYMSSDYQVKVNFKQFQADGQASDPIDPFKVASCLATNDLPYRASLKADIKGDYTTVQTAVRLLIAAGFDATVTTTLKLNDRTNLDFDHLDTWTNTDAVYKLNPKATSNDIDDLKGIYHDLQAQGYQVTIDVKAKENISALAEQQVQTFASLCQAYPENSQVEFHLQES